MKKTLIALMALAGVACGATITEQVQEKLKTAGYTSGESFTITLTFNGNWTGLTTSDNHLTLGTQQYNGVQYVNFSNGDSGWTESSDWEMNHSEYSSENSAVVASYTTISDTQLTGYWITPTVQITNEGKYQVSNGVIADTILTFTIAYDKETDTASFIATRDLASGGSYHTDVTDWRTSTNRTNTQYNNLNYTATTSFNVQGLTLDASKFEFGNAGISKVEVRAIPEPATATLSLLALCGLCARRRRA